MQNNVVDLKKEALKNGVIWGVISIVIFLITWYVMPSLMSSYAYAGLLAVVGITLAVFFTIDMRKKAGGYWTFSDALGKIFVMFIASALISYIFTIIFAKYIDPTYPIKMKELVLVKTESMLKSMGVDGSKLDEAMTATSERTDKQFTPTFFQAVTGFGISAIFYFVGALIFAAIFKKTNNNPFVNDTINHAETQL